MFTVITLSIPAHSHARTYSHTLTRGRIKVQFTQSVHLSKAGVTNCSSSYFSQQVPTKGWAMTERMIYLALEEIKWYEFRRERWPFHRNRSRTLV